MSSEIPSGVKVWLVEIRLKDRSPTPADGSRIVTYEEVLAASELCARYAGFDQFMKRCKYEPVLRRKLQSLSITTSDCCAPDAVELDV